MRKNRIRGGINAWQRMIRIIMGSSLAIVILMFSSLCMAGKQPNKIIIFSAASTSNAVTDICDLFFKHHHLRPVTSFAASSILARQIEHGAPAHVYISASLQWMDYLNNTHLIEPGTRINLLKNRIALVTPADSPLEKITIQMNFPLAAVIGDGRLAMGDPDHVPAGIYGRQAMIHLGIWDKIKKKLVRTKDVRGALVLTARGEVPMALVYITDAAISSQVKTIGLFPETSHLPIVYPAAIIAGQKTPTAEKFMAFLRSDKARKIFLTYGFESF